MGLLQCQCAAVLEAVISVSCLEILVIDMAGNMNTLGCIGQNTHAWRAGISSSPVSIPSEGKRATLMGYVLQQMVLCRGKK